MSPKDNKYLFDKLRKLNDTFSFSSFDYEIIDGSLSIKFNFNISEKYYFSPEITVKNNRHIDWTSIDISDLEVLLYNMGMVELISYWKSTCSPNVEVLPGCLNVEQIKFWKKLYYHGLGEFYYLNGIEIDEEAAMNISTKGKELQPLEFSPDENKVIVPIGGGKDSIVTLELLKSSGYTIIPMIVNPRAASWRTIEIAGFKREDCLIVHRSIDKNLLELNRHGYLNGHTPFSAMIAFTSALLAYLTNSAHVALSNESSANESTVPGSKINHQYSKSFEFENDFYNYSGKFLLDNFKYLSFLRPLNELQIAKLFSKYPQHFRSFRSCNVGSKTDSWCGKCPKCMFTYIILSPFVEVDELNEILGNDMLKDQSMTNIFKELTGVSSVKPFECVGTPEEVVSALDRKYDLKEVKLAKGVDFAQIADFGKLINEFNVENFLTDKFVSIIKKALND